MIYRILVALFDRDQALVLRFADTHVNTITMAC